MTTLDETKTVTIEDVLKTATERGLMNVHTALPGRVVSFNPEQSTVVVEPMINAVMQDGTQLEITPLADVPVQFPMGGEFVLTFPISKGDEGLLVFNERCIDGWWATGNKSAPLDNRMHDYSDANFIAGVSSRPRVVKNIFMDGASLRTKDDETHIRLTHGTIYIKGDIVHEGNTLQSGNYERDGTSTTTGKITGQSGLTILGDSQMSGGSITHNGKNIGDDHQHSGVQTGGGNTGAPI